MTGAAGRPALVALRALGLGDLLTAVPALRALRAAFPEHRLLLAAPAALAPLARLTGVVDELVPTAPLRPLPERLAGGDLAVNLHGRGPESHRVLRALRPRGLVAFACPAAGAAGPSWRADEHEVRRWCRLLEESGIPADPADLALEPASGAPPPWARGATLVHPGAAAPARRWPAERFAAVARAEAGAGRRVAVTGGPAEVGLARRVAALAGLPPAAAVAGRTDLLDLARAVAAAARVVSGDTGIAHLATALGTPSVVLFGPTPPTLWGPPRASRRHVALWAGRAGDPHGARPDPGLLRIGVGQVLAALAALPDGAGRAARLAESGSRASAMLCSCSDE